jgi:Trk K+ transport system NAD-binding subunit
VTARSGRLERLRSLLLRFFHLPLTDAVIGVLIVVSVTLTIVELSLEPDARIAPAIERINLGVTLVFVVELSLRFVAESARERPVRSFLRRWWIDLLAVVPALFPLLESFRVLRGARILRFLRLLRIARLFSAGTRFLPYVVRRGTIHLAIIVGALLSVILVGTAVILSFERLENPGIDNYGEAFWFSLFSLFGWSPPTSAGPPTTFEGRIALTLVLFVGLLVLAAFIGTISAFMVDRLQREGRGMKHTDRRDHVILCGLGQVGYRVLQTLLRLKQEVVAIERDEDSEFVDLARRARVPVMAADVRNEQVLEDAGVARARAVIACTEDDLTNLEVALNARHVRPEIRVVLRLFDQRLAEKIAEGFNIQVAFSSATLAAPAFAAAAIDRSVRGSLEVSDRLYIQSEFDVPAESALAGLTIAQLRDEFETHTLMYRDTDGTEHWAPTHDHAITPGTSIAVIGPFDKVGYLKEVCGITADLVRAAPRD